MSCLLIVLAIDPSDATVQLSGKEIITLHSLDVVSWIDNESSFTLPGVARKKKKLTLPVTDATFEGSLLPCDREAGRE